MTIASEVTRIKNNIASAYTVASGKGATLPATQNSDNLANCISTISISGTKYGALAGSLLGDVDANGVLQQPTIPTDLVFTGVKDVVTYGMYYKFYGNTGITSVSFPDLETVSTNSAMYNAFYGNTSLTSASFAKLTTISGTSGTQACFRDSSLASVSLSELTTVSGNSAMYYFFYGCPIVSITFTKLSDISGSGCLRYAFQNCKDITSISFPALKTTSFGSNVNQFNSMFNSNTASTSGTFTVHFPSNLQSTISGLTGYPTFGATAGRITLLYDLPSTGA